MDEELLEFRREREHNQKTMWLCWPCCKRDFVHIWMSKETLHNYRAEIQTVLNICLHGDNDTIQRFVRSSVVATTTGLKPTQNDERTWRKTGIPNTTVHQHRSGWTVSASFL
jgi:hypothetical protein